MDDDDDYLGRKSCGRAASHPKLVNINPEEDRNFPFCASNSTTWPNSWKGNEGDENFHRKHLICHS
jgi:hypothetical protein